MRSTTVDIGGVRTVVVEVEIDSDAGKEMNHAIREANAQSIVVSRGVFSLCQAIERAVRSVTDAGRIRPITFGSPLRYLVVEKKVWEQAGRFHSALSANDSLAEFEKRVKTLRLCTATNFLAFKEQTDASVRVMQLAAGAKHLDPLSPTAFDACHRRFSLNSTPVGNTLEPWDPNRVLPAGQVGQELERALACFNGGGVQEVVAHTQLIMSSHPFAGAAYLQALSMIQLGRVVEASQALIAAAEFSPQDAQIKTLFKELCKITPKEAAPH